MGRLAGAALVRRPASPFTLTTLHSANPGIMLSTDRVHRRFTLAKKAIVQSTPTPVGHPTSFSGKGSGGGNPPAQTTQATPNAAQSFNRERAQQVKHGKPVPMSQ